MNNKKTYKMKKKYLSLLVALIGVILFKVNYQTEETHSYIKQVKAHPYFKSSLMTKKERKALGLPPNAYFEQEYLNEMNPSTGRTHPENLAEIQRNFRNYRKSPGDKNSSWVERGPNNVGGRTRAILFDPNDNTNKRVFAGGVSGGLWVNNDISDINSSWQKVGIPENLAITCIVVDPKNSQIMYLGTGESYTSDNGAGNGVWKSTDGGATWTNVFSESSDDIRLRLFYINTIAAWVNPSTNLTEILIGVAGAYYRSSQQFLGSDKTGLYKTSNGGATWDKISLDTPNSTPYEPNNIEVAADNTIWMSSTRNVFGHGGGTIFSSTDGQSFVVKHTISNARRTEISLSKTNKDKVFVLAEGDDTTPIIMKKTEDSFATSSNMSLPDDADNDITIADFTRGQAFYDLVIETDPNNDQILYAGGIDLFRSTDAGTTWVQMSKWSNNNALELLKIPVVHADQHALVFHPTDPNKAVIGNDGGVYYASSLSNAVVSSDANNFIEPRNLNYNTMQFYNGAIGQTETEDVLLAGSQDNGTQFISNATMNSTNSSVEVFGGDGAYSFIDKDGEYMIVSYTYNSKARLNLPYDDTGINLDNDQNTGSFINAQALDDNLDILFSNGSFSGNNTTAAYDSIVRYSGLKDGEVLVKDKIGNQALNSTTTALKVSPFTTTSTKLFLGLQNGRVLKVENANADTQTWNIISFGIGLIFGGSVSDINFGKNENEILVTFHNYGIKNIWYTEDGGVTWTSKDGDLPDLPVKAIMMNPLDNNEVIIGTELGIWRTENFKDFAPNWVQSQNGMSNVKVTSLELRTSDNTILASTYGRGMFTSKFTDNTPASVDDVLNGIKAFTVYPTISEGNFTIHAKNDLGVSKIDIFNINAKKVYSSNVDFSSNEKHQVSVKLNPGVYFLNIMDQNKKKSSSKIIIQ